MNMLPSDPFMLLSFVNTKLRDQYPSIEALCDDLNVTRAEIDAVLQAAGFEYSAEQNKYW